MNGNTKNDVPIPEGTMGQIIMDYVNSGNSGSTLMNPLSTIMLIDLLVVTVIRALGEEGCVDIKDEE